MLFRGIAGKAYARSDRLPDGVGFRQRVDQSRARLQGQACIGILGSDLQKCILDAGYSVTL